MRKEKMVYDKGVKDNSMPVERRGFTDAQSSEVSHVVDNQVDGKMQKQMDDYHKARR